MKSSTIAAGVAAGVAAASTVGLTMYLRRQLTKALPGGEGTPAPEHSAPDAGAQEGDAPTDDAEPGTWTNLRPLPTAADVAGDLERNWGRTPVDLRPLFLLMEETSGIIGAGRIFSVIAYGESRWVTTAQRGDGDSDGDRRERDASARAYRNAKDRNPPLRHGDASAQFGSGGLFAALSPYFLWTGVPVLGGRAPLLSADPRVVFIPRVAAFGACVYLQRLLDHYRIDDHLDLKVGWASPSLLLDPPRGSRGGSTYQRVRTRFSQHASEVGIDFADEGTIPSSLSTASWPGVMAVFDALVGSLPERVG